MVFCPQNSLIDGGIQKNDSGQLFPASHLCRMDCGDLLEKESGQDREGGAMSQEAGFPPGCGLGQVPSPLWASVSSSVKWVHPFPAACVTTPHKLSGLKQHTLIILHSGGSGVHRVLPRLWLTCQQCSVLPVSRGGEPAACLSCLLESSRIPWLTAPPSDHSERWPLSRRVTDTGSPVPPPPRGFPPTTLEPPG